MSFEQKLAKHYGRDAQIADVGGYGLPVDDYGKRVKRSISLSNRSPGIGGIHKDEMSGGFPFAAVFAALPAIVSAIKHFSGDGHDQMGGGMINPFSKSGGYDRQVGYPGKYRGSFPMPGFSPPPDGSVYVGAPMGSRGSSLSGGKRHRVKNPQKVNAGKSAAKSNPWLRKLAEYRKIHGCTQSEAMKALKGT